MWMKVGSCRCVRSAVSGFEKKVDYSLINYDVFAKIKEKREYRGMKNCVCKSIQSSIQMDDN